MRVPKESPWKLSEPISFRKWMKKSMTPMGYDKALKSREKLAVVYFFMSLITLNVVIWDFSKRKEQSPTVSLENPILQDYLATSPPEENKETYIYSYENLKFKSVEVFSTKETDRKNREESSK